MGGDGDGTRAEQPQLNQQRRARRQHRSYPTGPRLRNPLSNKQTRPLIHPTTEENIFPASSLFHSTRFHPQPKGQTKPHWGCHHHPKGCTPRAPSQYPQRGWCRWMVGCRCCLTLTVPLWLSYRRMGASRGCCGDGQSRMGAVEAGICSGFLGTAKTCSCCSSGAACWDGMGRDEAGQQREDSLHSCREEPGQNEPQQKDRKSLPEGGKKSLGWHRCCLMPDGCWGSGKGLPAAALLGFAPQQVPVGDTGLEVALRNKWQKTRACLPANSIHLLGPLVFPKQPHHVLKSMCF